jgi:hypothetical protein
MVHSRPAYIALLSEKFKGNFRASFRRIDVMLLQLIGVDISFFTHEQLQCADCAAATGACNSEINLRRSCKRHKQITLPHSPSCILLFFVTFRGTRVAFNSISRKDFDGPSLDSF